MVGLVSLGAGLLAGARGEHVQTWVFLTIGLDQLGVAPALRASRKGVGRRGRGLEIAVAGAVLLQVTGVLVGPLRGLLGTVPVSGSDLALLTALAVVPGLLVGLERRLTRGRRGVHSPETPS